MGIDRANVTGPELAWLLFSLLAAVVNLILFVIATRDLLAVYESKRNGAKRIEAWTWHVAHGVLLLMQLDAVGIGAVSALSPPANAARATTTAGLVAILGLIAERAMGVALGLFLLWRRGKLDQYLDHEREARRRSYRSDGIPDDD